MRWRSTLASLWLLMVLTTLDAHDRNRPRNQDDIRQRKRKRARHGKQGRCVYQGLTMFDQAVWSPKPCVTCLCTGSRVVCEEITCPTLPCHLPFTPARKCCPICMEPGKTTSSDYMGDSPVPNDPSESFNPLTQEGIQRILWREEEERHKEELLRRKDGTRRKRRKERKEKAEIQRKLVEDRRREEEEALRLEVEREDEKWRRQMEEQEQRRRKEEERSTQEDFERQARENEMRVEEERRRQEEILGKNVMALEEEEEERVEGEEVVWLRGDVFQMTGNVPEKPDLLPVPIPRPATKEDELEEPQDKKEVLLHNRAGLPPGCDISDVTVACENAQLNYFPPLAIPKLKSLNLEGNNISSIPAEAFNGIPNLEWINLKKNKLTSTGIAKTFGGLKMLRRLYLDGNLLETVPSDLPSTLQELKISENRIRGINKSSFQDLKSLMILELEGNLLSEGNIDPMAFTHVTQLSYLRLGRNHLRTVPQGLPSTLLELYLENNLIEEISETVFNQTDSLNVVSLRHNRLDETRIAPMAWINHRNLESVDLSHNDLHLVPSFLPRSLVHLVLVGNNIERIPSYVFAHMEPGLEYLYLSYNKLDGEGIEPESFFGTYHSMIELCMDHNHLVTVPSGINEMTNLHFLRLNNNMIRSIPDDGICNPDQSGDSTLVTLQIENNYIDPEKISPTSFSCVHSPSSVVLNPQRSK
ncbi:extracellular matrix protein 2 [Genypterus blacodes]|uniref:extracellular matrix protein 2 n=1 Tax=Genypterus blacodes TaxID=154954 RepID=UPI003F775603